MFSHMETGIVPVSIDNNKESLSFEETVEESAAKTCWKKRIIEMSQGNKNIV